MKAKNNLISSAAVFTAVSHQTIADRAYAIWLERGQPTGRDYEHWIEAERRLQEPLGREPAETLSSRLHWDDPLSTDIERALNALSPSAGARSATSL